jgi:hypothetical protein
MPRTSSSTKNKKQSAAHASQISAEARTGGSPLSPLAPSTSNVSSEPRRKLVKTLRLVSNLSRRVKNVTAQLKRRCTTLAKERCFLATKTTKVQVLEAENATLNHSLYLLDSNHALLRKQYIELETAHRESGLQLQHLDAMKHDLIQANEHHELDRARIRMLLRELDKYKARERRAAAIKRHFTLLSPPVSVVKIKHKGNISDTARHKILELTRRNVGTQHIMPIFTIMADFFDVRLEGKFSETSVRRIIAEGGLAGYMQVAQAMREARCKFEYFFYASLFKP